MVLLALGLLLLVSPDTIPELTIPNADSMPQIGGIADATRAA
jgi:hypothetical protein